MKYILSRGILFVYFEINFVLCEKIVVNNKIIIFTNETDLTIYKLINYKHKIPTYVPCIHILCDSNYKCLELPLLLYRIMLSYE